MSATLTVWVQDSELKAPASSPEAHIIPYGWDWNTFHRDLLRAHARGEAPDIVEIGDTWTSRLVAEGVLLDITRLATKRLKVARLCFPRMLRYCMDPSTYRYHAVPLLADVRILFYNQDYIGSYLAEHPDAFQSWETFEDMCLAVQSQLQPDQRDRSSGGGLPYGDQGDRYAIAWPLGPDAFHDVLPWIWAMGGDIVSASGEVLLDSEPTQEAIRRLARLILMDCAPAPPYPPVKDLGELRTQFLLRRLAIIAGALWVMHGQETSSWIKSALHPADPLPAAFVGSSNIAIVRKHGDYEMCGEYEPAKQLLASSLTSITDQVRLATLRGKMPSNISAWQYMKQSEKNAAAARVLETIEHAMYWTTPHGLPNVPNLVHVEEALKACMQRIWLEIGALKRNSKSMLLEDLELTCRSYIAQELSATRQRIEPFLTSCTIQYSSHDIDDIGLQPPGTFDIWLELRSPDLNSKGNVYARGGNEPVAGIGQISLQLLRTLANAPKRIASREDLIRDIWGHNPVARDHQEIKRIADLIDDLGASIQSMQTSRLTADISKHLLRTVDLCEEIKQIILEHDERLRKFDTLRHSIDNLNQRLGPSLGKNPIERNGEAAGVYYALNRNLSICVVLP